MDKFVIFLQTDKYTGSDNYYTGQRFQMDNKQYACLGGPAFAKVYDGIAAANRALNSLRNTCKNEGKFIRLRHGFGDGVGAISSLEYDSMDSGATGLGLDR